MRLRTLDYSRESLAGYMCDIRQLADVRFMTLDDGLERGVRVAHFREPGGLEFQVLLDRAMDIGAASFRGLPLAWESGLGAVNPARYEAADKGWLRTFHGGLLALCGLTTTGYTAGKMVDTSYGDEPLGLHGRIGALPAFDIAPRRWFEGDEYFLELRGTIDEAVLFGHRLRLQRTITVQAGVPEIRIADTVTNIGARPSPLMVLYHCNLGFPLIAEGAQIVSPAAHVTPRDADAADGLETWSVMAPPRAGTPEQVFWHELPSGADSAVVTVFNPALDLGLKISFDPRQLSTLTQWKLEGHGEYVLGIEPGNSLPVGRVAAREQGGLRMLDAGASQTFDLRIRVITQEDES